MKSAIISIAIIAALSQPGTITYERAEAAPLSAPVTIEAEVSAYTSDPAETDEDPLITASGSTVQDGTIACPSRFEFGQIVEIEGKRYTCEDRMNARYRNTNHFDIWMENRQDAIEWGRRNVIVIIIKNEPKQSTTDRQDDAGH